MLTKLKQRYQDMKALSTLMSSAEQHSIRRNEGNKPGVEHFVLAAIESSDGAAKEVFQKLDIDATGFEDALREQYKETLKSMGIEVDDDALLTSDNSTNAKAEGLPSATESGSELMKIMAKRQGNKAFSSADILRAINEVPSGPTHRALQLMGTTPEIVAAAANE